MWTMPQVPPELLAQLSRGNGAPGPLPMDPTGSGVGFRDTSRMEPTRNDGRSYAALGGGAPALSATNFGDDGGGYPHEP